MTVRQREASGDAPLSRVNPLETLSRGELIAKVQTADRLYRVRCEELRDCRELLADAKRDADGWCERATKAEQAAVFWEREYEAAQEHVNDLKQRLGWTEESGDDE